MLHTLLMSETPYQVIVYQASGLHVCIEGGGTQELKSPSFHILCYGI